MPTVADILGPPPKTVQSILGPNPQETTTSSGGSPTVGLATYEDPNTQIAQLGDEDLQKSYAQELNRKISSDPQLSALRDEAAKRAAKGESIFNPLVNIPKVTASDLSTNPGLGSKIVAGVNQFAGNVAEGFTSPAAISTLGVGSAVAGTAKPLALLWSAIMGKGLPEQYAAAGTALGEGDVEKAIPAIGGAVLSTALTPYLAKTALTSANAPITGQVMADVTAKAQSAAREGQPTFNATAETPPAEAPAATTAAESVSPTPSGVLSAFTSGLDDLVHAKLKDSIGQFAGETLPITTRIDQASGEKGARYLSSPIAAEFIAKDFIKDVLPPTYEPVVGKLGWKVASDVDPVKFGAALSEDNLRSVRDNFVQQGLGEEASAVKTLVGEDRIFKTEKEYQDYLNSPDVQAAIERYKELWDEKIDPMYKQAMSIDPEEVLPSRGQQTGARVNLLPEEIAVKNEGGVPTSTEGGQSNTLKRSSPFGRKATGSSEGYRTNFGDMMRNTIGRQLEIANKNAFDNSLVDTGNAVIDEPGKQVDIGGKPAIPFDYIRKNLLIKNEIGEVIRVPQNRKIYVNADIAKEYRRAANLDATMLIPGVQGVFDAVTKLQLAGLVDAGTHVSNLFTTLFTRPGIIGNTLVESSLAATGRADVPFIIAKAIAKGFQDNSKQIAELAEIGAMRGDYKTTGLNVLNSAVHFFDATTRLVLDDAYHRFVKDGLVEDSETGRREFVNQVGQYNKRAQTAFTAMLRDTKLAPFITAGKNFNALAVRYGTLSPGVDAVGNAQAAALRLQVASKWAGSFALIGLVNYMFTGKMAGRPGTPIGRIDLGRDDEAGRPLTFPALDVLGGGRTLRITGIRSAVDSDRLGLPTQTQLDGAFRDILNTAASPLLGPAIRSAFSGASGYDIALDVGRKYPVVPPSESQHFSDATKAIMDINPIAGAVHAASQPGATVSSVMQKQLPRYLPTSGKPPEMVEKYADIVRMAKTGNFTDDMIGRVRKMAPDVRSQVVTDAYYSIDVKDRAHFLRTLKQRRIDFVLGTPTAQ